MFGRKVRKTNSSLTVLKTVKLQDQSGFQHTPLNPSHVSLVKTRDAAKISMTKRGLGDKKFAVGVLIDNSGSMGPSWFNFYGKGYVQTLTEFALGYAFEVDTDGLIPVGVFGSTFSWASTDLTQDNYRTFIQSQGWNGNGGGTATDRALVEAENLFDQAEDPSLLLVITDGYPNDKRRVMQQLEQMSRKPMFIKWLIIGEDRDALRFGREIDDELNGLVDNVDMKNYSDRDLATMTPEKFAEDMSDEIDIWINSCKTAGIIL